VDRQSNIKLTGCAKDGFWPLSGHSSSKSSLNFTRFHGQLSYRHHLDAVQSAEIAVMDSESLYDEAVDSGYLGRKGCDMKTLFLIRHAKSSWDDTALPDRDRPLDDRGERDVAKMGKRLVERKVKADLIMSSPAKRALATAEVIAKMLDYKRKDIVVNHRLYASQVDDLLDIIQELDHKLKRVMLVGHNPELTELAHYLSSEIAHMPTCAIAEFTLHAKSWSTIGKAKPDQVTLDYPKKSLG
jgi:phosphohistidine phosphatase